MYLNPIGHLVNIPIIDHQLLLTKSPINYRYIHKKYILHDYNEYNLELKKITSKFCNIVCGNIVYYGDITSKMFIF